MIRETSAPPHIVRASEFDLIKDRSDVAVPELQLSPPVCPAPLVVPHSR